jgi:hypothetical protein
MKNQNIKGEHGSGAFKGRGSIEQIVTELRRQVDNRHDFVIDTREIAVGISYDGDPVIIPATDSARDFVPRDGYPLLDSALMQVGGRACEGGIPSRFLKRVWDDNPYRTSDFLTGLMHDDGNRRLIRVLDGNVRAFLSNKFKCIDNLAIAEKAMNVAISHNAVPIEASVTDSKMRLRFVSKQIGEALQRVRDDNQKSWFAGGLGKQTALSKVAAQSWGELPGDTVHPALGFSNSETGHGGCDLDGGILLGACFNLAWVRKMIHEVHLGAALDEGVFSQDTAIKHADLVYAKINDAVDSYFTADSFAKVIAGYDDAQKSEIRAPSVACRVAITASDALNESDLDNLLSFFVQQPGSTNEFNLGQAVSRLAQEVEPDRANELETFAHVVCTGKLGKEIERATVKAAIAVS